MKKKMFLVICLLIFTVVLSGCVYTNQLDGDNKNDYNMGQNNDELDCEAYGYFSNLDDFYTFATTGSREASKYTDPYTAREVHWYNSIDSSALLKVEEIFNDQSLIEKLAEVQVYEKNEYTYVFDDGMAVNIRYNAEMASTIGKITMSDIYAQKGTNYITESEANKFSVNAPVDTVYVKTVDDIGISRQKVKAYKVEYFRFSAQVGSFKITIDAYWGADNSYSSLEEWMNDPKNQSVMAFFDDASLPAAINTLKTNVMAKKNASGQVFEK